MAGFHTGIYQHVGGGGVGHVKIMILEVRFLLTNFDSTSAIFKTLYLELNKLLGGGDLVFGGGYPRAPSPPVSKLKLLLSFFFNLNSKLVSSMW